MIDGIIVIIVAAAISGVVWKKVKDHKEGKSGCGCGCGCRGCVSKGTCQK
ncbi:MAG: FeoB-associated Cys-rich membrane protein [Hungatella sp.]|nr:FeoB-associated Cys-rich membrane protein [Hungatella sp.]